MLDRVPPEIRGDILDQLWDRFDDSRSDWTSARYYLSDLRSLSLVTRSWTADAQARLRLIVCIDFDHLHRLGGILERGVQRTIQHAFVIPGDRPGPFAHRERVESFLEACPNLRDVAGWDRVFEATDRFNQSAARPDFPLLERLHLYSPDQCILPSSLRLVSLTIDDWFGGLSFVGSLALPTLRHLRLCASNYQGDGLDIDVQPLVASCPNLVSLRLRAVLVKEVPGMLTNVTLSHLRALEVLVINATVEDIPALGAHAGALIAVLPASLKLIALGDVLDDRDDDAKLLANRTTVFPHVSRAIAAASAPLASRSSPPAMLLHLTRLLSDRLEHTVMDSFVAAFEGVGLRCSLKISACRSLMVDLS